MKAKLLKKFRNRNEYIFEGNAVWVRNNRTYEVTKHPSILSCVNEIGYNHYGVSFMLRRLNYKHNKARTARFNNIKKGLADAQQ